MFEHLESIFVLFAVDEVSYVIENIYRRPNSKDDGFISEVLNFLNTVLTEFQNYNFLLWVTSNITYFR